MVDIGIMSALALFLAIPASFLWGYVCDRTRHYKRYILISFLASAILLYCFTLSTNMTALVLLYAVMSVLHTAHEPAKNVLVAELYSRKDWERSFAFYEGFTEAGWLIGLLFGFFTSAYGFSQNSTLLLCSFLNLVAFFLSLLLVADPILVFERGLVSIEKSIDFAYKGIFLASRILDGSSFNEKLKKENLSAFCLGLVLFSLATSILFTPMPIFVSTVAESAGLTSSFVFAIFVLNSGGGVLGYFLAGTRSNHETERNSISRFVILRCLLSLLLILVLWIPAYSVAVITTVLISMGFVYALFLVHMLSLSMELIPRGKAGLFNVLVGIGSACGSFLGPFLAQTFGSFGFTIVFIAAGLVFCMSYIAFKLFT